MTASPPPVPPDDRLAEHARARTHLVVPAEHPAAERLDALARVEGAPGSGLPRVLFVCSHNAGGSRPAAPSSHAAPKAT